MKNLLLLFIIIALYGCNNKKESSEAIMIGTNLTNHKCEDTLLFTDLKIIFLETNNKNLIGMVSKIILFENNIYILDEKGRNVLVFDSEGHFLTTIGKHGRGPGEFLSITDFSINFLKKEIIICSDNPNKFLFFDTAGNLKKEIPGKDLYYAITSENDTIICINAASSDTDNYISMIEYNNKKITDIKKLPLKQYRLSSNFSLGTQMLKSQHILFTKRYDNIIYKLHNKEIVPYYQLDFKEHNFPKTLLTQNLSETDFNREVSRRDIIYSIVNPKETPERIFFNTHKLGTFVIDKNNSKADYYKFITNSRLDVQHSRMIPTEDISNNRLCFIANMDQLKNIMPYSKCTEEWFKDKVNKASENDNPILFIYTSK